MERIEDFVRLPPHAKAVDIRTETCPMTLVRTRLALDALKPGEILLVRLSGEEPTRSVPAAVIDQGHDVQDLITKDDGSSILVIVKDGLR